MQHANVFTSFLALPAIFLRVSINIDGFVLQRAKEKSRSMWRREAPHPRSLGWSSRMFSAELSTQYSKKTSVRPKNCKSPFPNSWGWSWAPSAISLWTRVGGVWINGRTMAAPTQSIHLPHQALVPKHEWEPPPGLNLGGIALK